MHVNGTKNVIVPSHTLYVDDKIIFCKGDIRTIKQYEKVLDISIYVGAMRNAKNLQISFLLGFTIGTLPFIFLRAPIFIGIPKTKHFQLIVDKIKSKLCTWKSSLLSLPGRVQLVKYVIHNMLI